MATIRKRKGAKGTHYQAIVRRTGYPDQRRTFDTEQEAQEWASDLERDIRDRKIAPHRIPQRKTLADAIDTYLPKIKHTKNFKDTERLCLWWRDRLGTASLSELTAIAIDLTLDTIDCSGPTKNRYLGALSGCLRFVSRTPYNWIAVNPCRSVTRREEHKGRQRIITAAEWKQLLAYVDKAAVTGKAREQQLPTYLRLAYATGRRRGELLKLRWDCVDLDECLLYLLDTKTGDDEVVPIDAATARLLQAHADAHKVDGWPLVFRGRFPNKMTNYDDLIREAMRAVFTPDRRGEMPVFHSVRHTAATELGDAGATESQIMAVTGHKSSASVQRYVKKTTASARAAQQLRAK